MLSKLVRIIMVIVIAILAGKLATRLGMPAVLGVLITGMALGTLCCQFTHTGYKYSKTNADSLYEQGLKGA